MIDNDKEKKQFEFSERKNFITSQWKIAKANIKGVRKLLFGSQNIDFHSQTRQK